MAPQAHDYMAKPLKVGITHGDINGIGYEVILGALAHEVMTESCIPVVFGFHSIAEKCRKMLSLEEMHLQKVNSPAQAVAGRVNIIDVAGEVPEVAPGRPTEDSGRASVAALEAAVEALKAGEIDVLVTAPISKEAVQSDEFRFPGHTEFLQERIGDGAKARMILFDDYIRVALVSTHLPISKVAQAVTKESVEEAIDSLHESLRRDFGFERPRIAVLSLNPHAGDGGLLGNEEAEQIIPAIGEAREKGVLAFGPYAADGFFGAGDYRRFDGVVAMYHDQGLAPFKALAGEHGVNYTAGLPFVRTSPDHGTAFGIAWKGEADPTSMREAIYKAIDIYRRREIFDEAASNPLSKHVAERPEKGERQQMRQNGPKRPDADRQAPRDAAPQAPAGQPADVTEIQNDEAPAESN